MHHFSAIYHLLWAATLSVCVSQHYKAKHDYFYIKIIIYK